MCGQEEDQAMADENRSFDPEAAAANRAPRQGLGMGQREIDEQRSPNRAASATDPERTEPFDQGLDPTTNADRPSQADVSGQDVGPADAAPEPPGSRLNDRNAVGLGEAGDLGASTPANVDIHNLGQSDRPEEAWGEPAGEGATYSSDNTRKGLRIEAERGQGAKTRQLNKDIVSRRT